MNQNLQSQPGSQAELTTYHPAHHHAQGKGPGPANQRVTQKGQSPYHQEAAFPSRRRTNNIQATKNQPTDKQIPFQYKAEKNDAAIKPSDAHPVAPTHNGQSCTSQDHHPTTTARHTAGDRMQAKSIQNKSCAHNTQMCPHQHPKNKDTRESVAPQKCTPAHRRPTTSTPKSKCLTPIHQPDTATKAPPRVPPKPHPGGGHSPQRQTPQMSRTQKPHISNNSPQDKAKGPSHLLGD
ncbi:hypothetical protein CRENBAI_000451 [Crenichthys baileyi]|uniref:Uncharacterized protein n=1 Tax=Crenichthys baileyi TaxID=28760 RepID=A0AAV9QXI6_9TELE